MKGACKKRLLADLDELFSPTTVAAAAARDTPSAGGGGRTTWATSVVRAEREAKIRLSGNSVSRNEDSKLQLNADAQRFYARLAPRLLEANPSQDTDRGDIRSFMRDLLPKGELLLQSKMLGRSFQVAGEGGKATRGSSDKKALERRRETRGWSGRRCKRQGLDRLAMKELLALPFGEVALLHSAWQEYARELVGHVGNDERLLMQRLQVADLLGAFVRVTQAATPSQTGLAGIVVHDSRECLLIATPPLNHAQGGGGIRRLVKKGCRFAFAVDGRIVWKGPGPLL